MDIASKYTSSRKYKQDTGVALADQEMGRGGQFTAQLCLKK